MKKPGERSGEDHPEENPYMRRSYWDWYMTGSYEGFPRESSSGALPSSEEPSEELEWLGDEWGDWRGIFRELFEPAGVEKWERAVEIAPRSGKYTLPVIEHSDATVRAYDVRSAFLEICRKHCEEQIRAGRLELEELDMSFPGYLLGSITKRGWRGRVDGFYSIGAMAHVDLQHLITYLLTAALALRQGGQLVMTLATATSERGFAKLLDDIEYFWRGARRREVTAKYQWLSPDIVESILMRFGFELEVLSEEPHRDLHVVATLSNPEAAKQFELNLFPGLKRKRDVTARHVAPSNYLGACTIYRDHAHELREWIEFHRLVGVERFILYDNGSTDDHRDQLAPYLEQGIVELYDWPRFPGQRWAFNHCVKHHGDELRWIAFLDIDEFLFSPTGKTVSEVLTEFESYPAVGVNRHMFGTSGHRHRPDGLVIENFTYRARVHRDSIKSIVDPKRVLRCIGAHHFVYQQNYRHPNAVDENHNPIDPVIDLPGLPPGRAGGFTSTLTHELLRIHHYETKSEEELRAKLATRRPDTGDSRPTTNLLDDPSEFEAFIRLGNAVRDEELLTYVPKLREVLAQVERQGSQLR